VQVNEKAKVSVKLVAQAGIGTVASGVAKANADIIQVGGGWGRKGVQRSGCRLCASELAGRGEAWSWLSCGNAGASTAWT